MLDIISKKEKNNMFNTLTKKTKIWMFIAFIGAVLLIVAVINPFRSELLKGALSFTDSTSSVYIQRNGNAGMQAIQLPDNDFIRVMAFDIFNNRSARITVDRIGLKMVATGGAAADLRNNIQSVRLKLRGDSCIGSIGEGTLNSSNEIIFTNPYGSGTDCYSNGIAINDGETKEFRVEVKFRDDAFGEFHFEVETLAGSNGTNNFRINSDSRVDGPNINVFPSNRGLKVDSMNTTISDQAVMAGRDGYFKEDVFKFKVTNNTLGFLDIERILFSFLPTEGGENLLSNQEQFKLDLPDWDGCNDPEAFGSIVTNTNGTHTIRMESDDFFGDEGDDNCRWDDALGGGIPLEAGENIVMTLFAGFQDAAVGKFKIKLANAYSIRSTLSNNVNTIPTSGISGQEITVNQEGLYITEAETLEGGLPIGQETEVLTWDMFLIYYNDDRTVDNFTIEAYGDFSASEFSASGLIEDIDMRISGVAGRIYPVIETGAGTEADPHLIKFSGIDINTGNNMRTKLRIELKNSTPVGKNITFRIPENGTGGIDYIPLPSLDVFSDPNNPPGFYAQSGTFTTTESGITLTALSLPQTFVAPSTDDVTVFKFRAETFNEDPRMEAPIFTIIEGDPNDIENVSMIGFDDDDDFNPERFARTGDTISYDGSDMEQQLLAGIPETLELKVSFSDTALGDYKFELTNVDASFSGIPILTTLPLESEKITVGGTPPDPGDDTLITVTPATITPAPTGDIDPGVETAILSFNIEADNSVDVQNFTLRLSADSTLPRNQFESIKLMQENNAVVTSTGAQLSNFVNFGNLTLSLPFLIRNLPAGEVETYTILAKLASGAPLDGTFKLQLDDIQSSPLANVTGTSLVSDEFTVTGEAVFIPPPPPPPPPDNSGELDALQSQIEMLQQQLLNSLAGQGNGNTAQITATLEALIAAQNAARTNNNIEDTGPTIIPTDPNLGIEEEVEDIRLPFPEPLPTPPPPVQSQVQTYDPNAYAASAPEPTYVQPTLVSSPRLARAPERGDTGPGILIYIGMVAAGQGVYIWRKQRRK